MLTRIESGSDDPDYLGHYRVTFLVGQVDLIHKLNYLDVTHRSHVLYSYARWLSEITLWSRQNYQILYGVSLAPTQQF